MPKDTDAHLQDRLDLLRGKGAHEAETTLLLDQKVGHVEKALMSVEETMDSICNVLDAMLEKMNSTSG